MCIFQKQPVIFAVKNSYERIGKYPDQSNHDNFYRHYTGQTPVKKFFYIISCTFTKAFTDQRLRPL